MPKNSWNKMSGWYDGMVGDKGHKYHQEYAIPTVLKLLDLKEKQKVLEIGCGQGALAHHITSKGAKYYGIDLSPNLIQMAKKRHRSEGNFYVGNAASLGSVKELENNLFDSIVFMLSIQDMAPLETILQQAIRKLKENGRIVIFMMHPAFRIPRQSGWGEDKKRKLLYRRVDRYMTESTIPLNTNVRNRGKAVTSYFYHRPLHKYIEELAKNGIVVDTISEITDSQKEYGEFPTFLALRGVKGN